MIKIINQNVEKLNQLKQQRELLKKLKFEFEYSKLHKGKLLINAKGINISFEKDRYLWFSSLDFELYSGERIHIKGNNGSGKTTLVKIITEQLVSTLGKVENAEFKYWYLDQEYSLINVDYTVLEIAQKYNRNNLKDNEVKNHLIKALFTVQEWSKNAKY